MAANANHLTSWSQDFFGASDCSQALLSSYRYQQRRMAGTLDQSYDSSNQAF